MQFVSFEFLALLPIIVLVNFLIPVRFRYLWLLFTSYAFYLSIDVKGTIVLVLSTVITYASGLMLEKAANDRRKKAIFTSAIVANVAIIVILKYLGFLEKTVTDIAGILGGELNIPAINLIAPIGISFYILKAMSYLIDVKRGKISPEKNFARYALFVSFFPQIIAGPIDRADNLLPQLEKPATLDFDRLRDGLLQMLWGYFLKLVIADRLAIFVNSVYSQSDHVSGGIAFAGIVLYTFELYCDFCGYSHIGIGAARILGIEAMKNFDSPLLAQSISEFWRRWHISLSAWLKDYVYISLGGSRKGTVRKYFNLVVTFAVSGLWHGTGWTYVFWGMLHAFYQIIGDLLMPLRDQIVRIFRINTSAVSHRILRTVGTFMLFSISLVFFRAESIPQAITILRRSLEISPWILTDGQLLKMGLDLANLLIAIAGILILIAVDIANYNGIEVRKKVLEQGLWFRYLVAIAGVLIVVICGIWGPGYDAASFIYQQF